jgi:hypothetical protein
MVYPLDMKRPIFARPLSDAERKTLKAGLRSPDAFTLRRCQILLASADEKKNAYQIARELGCHDQTARNAIHEFKTREVLRSPLPGAPPNRISSIGPSILKKLRSSGRCFIGAPQTSARTPACGRLRWPHR